MASRGSWYNRAGNGLNNGMNNRLILAIISTILEEAILAGVVLLGLPRLGINIPLPILIALMLGWAIVAVTLYTTGSRALGQKPVVGPEAVIGSRGRVVRPLEPEGLIRLGGELWRARSLSGKVDAGAEVTVVKQEGTLLIVRHGS